MFSYQLYSSRNFPPLGDTLAMLAGAGYAAVEGYGAVYPDAEAAGATAQALAQAGLRMPTAHFALAQLESGVDQVLAICRVLGIERVYCPYLMPADRPTDAQGWRDFGARLQAAGAPYRAAGLGFGWHNHDFEFHPLPDGSFPQQHIFDGGPDLEWEIDVAWVQRGGADPLAWIDRHQGRITAAHVKDIAPAGQNGDEDGWADVGQGTVGWSVLLPRLRAIGVRHFIMEHDNPADHARFARRSIAAVQGF